MTKRNANTNNAFVPVPLKTVLRDIERDNKGVTMNDKRVRAWLRANMRDDVSHDHNSSWVFTSQTHYDRVRSQFDPAYRAKIERATKRATSTPRVRKSRKIDANNHVVNNELHDTPNADA